MSRKTTINVKPKDKGKCLGFRKKRARYLEASIENLAKHPEVFNSRKVSVQGFLVVQQIFARPTAYYLRDAMNNMIPLKLSQKIDLSGYSKIKATGVFKASNKEIQMTVDEVTPLEA